MSSGIEASGLAACSRCGETKPVEAFYADRSRALGRKSICKPCDLEKSRDYYAATRVEQLRRHAERAPQRLCKCGEPAVSQRHWYCVRCGGGGAA